MSEIETCSICYNELEEPITLDCDHKFCGECLESDVKLKMGHPTLHCPQYQDCMCDIHLEVLQIYNLTTPAFTHIIDFRLQKEEEEDAHPTPTPIEIEIDPSLAEFMATTKRKLVQCPYCRSWAQHLGGCKFVSCVSKECSGKDKNFCVICGKALERKYHWDHFLTDGPMGDKCNTTYGIQDPADTNGNFHWEPGWVNGDFDDEDEMENEEEEEVEEIQEDIQEIKEDIQEIKEDIQEIKQEDIQEIKEEMPQEEPLVLEIPDLDGEGNIQVEILDANLKKEGIEEQIIIAPEEEEQNIIRNFENELPMLMMEA